MIDDLQELRTFVRIVGAGSLSAAAREIGVRLDVVSKRLAALERRVGTRLIARTTRRLSPTDEGRDLYARAQRILAELDEAETALRRGHAEPSGLLRVSAPVSLGRTHVAGVCAALAREHPALSIELILTDRLVDLVEERIDVAVRIGQPADSSAMLRKLVDNHRVLVAAHGYVAAHGMPETPGDLGRHTRLSYGAVPAPWRLIGPDGARRDISLAARLASSDGDVAYRWALDGCGIILKSLIDVAGDLAAGRLVQILPGWRSEAAPVCALYPANRTPAAKVVRFLDAMALRLRAALKGTPATA